jgi:hypothetical protein
MLSLYMKNAILQITNKDNKKFCYELMAHIFIQNLFLWYVQLEL